MLCLKLFLLLLAIVAILAANDRCVTPAHKPGRCVPLSQCRSNFPAAKCSMREKVKHVCCESDAVLGQNFFYPTPRQKGTTIRDATLSLKQITNCGVGRIRKISNGENAFVGEYNWMALLRYHIPVDAFHCAGSLITNRYVLTAAHCFTLYRPCSVRLGEHTLSTVSDCVYRIGSKVSECYTPQDFGIQRWQVHPNYDHAQHHNDIALIKLNRNVVFDKHINPICLPITKSSQRRRSIRSFIAAGWGRTHNKHIADALQKVTLRSRELSACRALRPDINITDRQMCVGGNSVTDTCLGDSGGPLFYYVAYNGKHRFVQYGITSYGLSECGAPTAAPSVYTNIMSYLPWIKNNIT